MHWLSSLFILVMSGFVYHYIGGVAYLLQPRHFMDTSRQLRGIQFLMACFIALSAVDLCQRVPFFSITVY